MRMQGAMIGSAIVISSIGLGAFDYFGWSIYHGKLADDDFWDHCRFAAMRGELEPGRYEGLVEMQRNETGACEEVRGYCIVNIGADGKPYGDALEEHQISVVSDAPSNCTYFGGRFDAQSPRKRVN